MSEDDIYRKLFLEKQNQLLDITQRALELQKRLDDMKDFHPRAAKLMKKQKNFIVVAEDEPYFIKVYEMIRYHEKEKGTWTGDDESLFVDALRKKQIAKGLEISMQVYDERHKDYICPADGHSELCPVHKVNSSPR